MQYPGYTKAATVTPSDTVPLDGFTVKALFVGTAGDLSVLIGGTTVVLKGVNGQIIPVAARRVNATGTTATNIVALGD